MRFFGTLKNREYLTNRKTAILMLNYNHEKTDLKKGNLTFGFGMFL